MANYPKVPVRAGLRMSFALFCILEGYFGLFPELAPSFVRPIILSNQGGGLLISIFNLVFLVTGASIATGVYPKQSSIIATGFLGLNLIIVLHGSGLFSDKEFNGITDTALADTSVKAKTDVILDLRELNNIDMGIGHAVRP